MSGEDECFVHPSSSGCRPGPASSKRRASGASTPALSPVKGTEASSRTNSPTPSVGSVASISCASERASDVAGEEQSVHKRRKLTRSRGRLPTTGEYIGNAAARREYVEARRAEMLLDEEESILDPTTLLPRSTADALKADTFNLVCELGNAPVADVASRGLEAARQIAKVSTISKGLKSTMAGQLRRSTAALQACVEVLTARARIPPEAAAIVEVAALRKELEAARVEREDLRAEIERLKRAREEKTPPAQNEPRPKRARARTRWRDSTTSDEDTLASVPAIDLPPRDEWPPVVRPPLRGHSKVLEDPPPPVLTASGPPPPAPPPTEERVGRMIEAAVARAFAALTNQAPHIPGPRLTPPEGRPHAAAWAASGASPKGSGGKTEKGRGGKGGKGKKAATSAARPPSAPAQKAASQPQAGARRKAAPPPPLSQPATPSTTAAAGSWVEVVRRGKKKDAARKEPARVAPGSQRGRPEAPAGKAGPARGGKRGNTTKAAPATPAPAGKPRVRPPRAAAVTVTCPEKGMYAEVLRAARGKIDLGELGIQSLNPKRAVTGALILEVPGADSATRADALAERIREALRGYEGIRVARPVKTAEMRIKKLDDSATAEDVISAVAEAGGCPGGQITVGAFRNTADGLRSVVAKCPATAVSKIAKVGKIRVGWANAPVEALLARPLQCYKCLEKGHARSACPNEVDRSGLCYRCGLPGHNAAACVAAPRCPVCTAVGRPAGHRVGSAACSPPRRKKKGGKKASGGTPAPSTAPVLPQTSTPPPVTQPLAIEAAVPTPMEVEDVAAGGPVGPEAGGVSATPPAGEV